MVKPAALLTAKDGVSVKSWQDNYLAISDLQVPFEHQDALKFCQYLVKHFKIPSQNIYNVGDETDQYFGGLWKKSPEAKHTPNTEIADSIRTLKRWYKAFPEMKLALSNHGTRWWRKAVDAEIPSQLLRRYEDIIQAPEGWTWKKRFIVKAAKKPFMIEHGDDWGGAHPHIQAAMHNGISVILGHHHSKAGTRFIKTANLDIWANISGSLIDFDQYAFQYARSAKLKPLIGCTVVVDGGNNALWIPLNGD